MTRLSLRSLAARPLRTALTTLAIVLGVALISGSLTLTDTQRKAADALSSASYDGTDAVVSAKTAFKLDSTDRKSTRLNSSHANISYAVFCLKKKKIRQND